MRKWLRNVLQGLVVLLPLLVTLWVVIWLLNGAEGIFRSPLEWLLGKAGTAEKPDTLPGVLGLESVRYFWGMSIALSIVLAIVLGLLARFWLFRGMVAGLERIVTRIPLLKTLYTAVRDLVGFMGGGKKKLFTRTVLVKVSGSSLRLLGLVTRESLDDIAGLKEARGRLAVYIPMTYNLGGFTVLVPPSDVEEVSLHVADAMRFSLTGGVSVTEDAVALAPKETPPPDEA